MRQIKFRGKTACCQLATAEDVWVYGGVHSIFENDDTCYIAINNYFEKNKSEKLLVKKNTIGQFTGVYDKNGKEIYEGDILTNGDSNIKYVVEWEDTGLMGRQWNNRSYIGLSYWNDRLEVIGNTTDNKNLLEGE